VRKALYLLLALGLLAVAAFGVVGSAAWFTDGATVPISATGATLDIRAEVGPPGGPVTYYDPTGVALSVDNLAPGALSDKVMISVQNKGNPASTLDVKYRYRSLYTASSPGFWDALNVQVEYGACGGFNLSYVMPTFIYDGPVENLSFTSVDNDYNTGDYLPVNNTHCYRFAFYLDETAGNGLQGGSATFDVVIDATQPENPGWAE
jgi:hypothetical protein